MSQHKLMREDANYGKSDMTWEDAIFEKNETALTLKRPYVDIVTTL